MSLNSSSSLWHVLNGASAPAGGFLSDGDSSVALGSVIRGSFLGGRGETLRGRCVLLATKGQLAAALALIELDGIARRLVLCPPDLPLQYFPSVIDCAAVDAIVSDDAATPAARNLPSIISSEVLSASYDRTSPLRTEWVLLTSGTTGIPKLVVHTLATLTGAIDVRQSESPIVWSTFYDIRRYGGLQIFLRAVLNGTSLVLSSAEESTAEFLDRAAAQGVTHISGTPSHWRRASLSPSARKISPVYIRLSGEIADQAILNHLQSFYPQAGISHAFASTEAGVAFEVTDGLEGFPASMIGRRGDVEMKVEHGSLRIRSTRTAHRYLNSQTEALKDKDGFVDTGDTLEFRHSRYYFRGRRDGVINVGGLKVHPEEVEAVINRHPEVRMSVVRARRSSITGALVVADVVPTSESANKAPLELRHDILRFCRKALPSYKVPAAINILSSLAVAETGKLIRN